MNAIRIYHGVFRTLFFLVITALIARGAPEQTIETVDHVTANAEAFRDPRAQGGRSAGLILSDRSAPLLDTTLDLPPGDYAATFHLLASPAEVIHHLAVTLNAGTTAVTLRQIQFDTDPDYLPYEIRFSHAGGPARFGIRAAGGSGFDGMRRELSEHEQTDIPDRPTLDLSVPGDAPLALDDQSLAEALDLLETERHVRSLSAFDHHLLCDRIEVRAVRLSEAVVREVTVDKVHYAPGETVTATVELQAGGGAAGRYELVAEEITEIDDQREVHRQAVDLGSDPTRLTFSYRLTDVEFGHKLRVGLERDGTRLHDRFALFGVSRNVYRIGITGHGGPQDMRPFTREHADALMARNQAAYANYFERFAWAPCDYSDLAPETEIFYSGQVQYPGSITGYQNLLAAAHARGIKGITYGKSCAAGIAGFHTFRRHPEFFGHRPAGPATEAFNTFYLERMLANDYLLHVPPSEGGWSHWPSLWTRFDNDEAVRFGAQAVIDSVEMFGWDGIRWDGHFVGNQMPFIEMLNEAYPDFVHGYNIAFADPGSSHFLPRGDAVSVADFHTVARNHGLMMDESARDWSHTNYSPGFLRPFYEALSREADYIKRIGGLPLYITFDMASNQDYTFNVLCGLSAGQRYTYGTSPGDFLYGPLPRFLTRYSALVWDDTALIAEPDHFLSVTVGGAPADEAPWWRHGVWLRPLGDARFQLLVNLLNPPRYRQFCNRVQTPPTPLSEVGVRLRLPDGAVLERVVHASPDLSDGHALLETATEPDGRVSISLPQLRLWSIVAFEFTAPGDGPYPLTTPVEDAAAIIARNDAEREAKDAAQRAAAGIAPSAPLPTPTPPTYMQYDRKFNADESAADTVDVPDGFAIRRNGRLDVHHARGAFAWLNPVEAALGLLNAGRYEPSWVDYVGFRRNDNRGSMDEFPDTFERLREFDVLVLDNLHAVHLGRRRRLMVREYVKAGGGLLVFGGYFNLSLGADHNTALADLLPVRIRAYDDVRREPGGMRLTPDDPDFFGERVNWERDAVCFTLDTSPPKDGAKVLLRADGLPAMVAQRFGEGRVITVLMNPHGDDPDDLTPYWHWAQWPRVIAASLDWLGEEAARVVEIAVETRAIDPAHPTPDDLFVEAFQLSSAEFTRRLQSARVNMVDAESARLLLETAIENVEKIEDMQILSDVVERTRPYFDERFGPLGERLTESAHEFIRQAGYQILGIVGDPVFRLALERALRDSNRETVREVLIALGRLNDPAAADAVRNYIAGGGSEAVLAHSVLLRFGAADVLPEAMNAFEEGYRRRIRLKSGKRFAHETLYGGTAFKLTPESRRRHNQEYRRVIRLEQEAIADLAHFNATLATLDEPYWMGMVDFYVATETPEMLSSAYALINRIPEEKAGVYRERFADAHLPFLRLLAEDG